MVKTSSGTEKSTPLKKGAWSPEEDRKLTTYIKRYKIWNWTEMSKAAGLARSGKSCRLRWVNYLRPDIKRGNFSKEEEETIITLHETLGNRWSAIAAELPPGRTDNEVKNYWHTHLKKRLKANSTSSSTSVIPELQEAGDEASWKNLSESDILASPEHPAESISKLDDSKNTVVSPQQPITSSTGPTNFVIGKDQNIVDEGINIDKTSSHETFIEELQSLWSQQGDFFDPPHDDQLIGPSTNSPIWQYDFYKEFDDCYDWVQYMDKTFGNS